MHETLLLYPGCSTVVFSVGSDWHLIRWSGVGGFSAALLCRNLPWKASGIYIDGPGKVLQLSKHNIWKQMYWSVCSCNYSSETQTHNLLTWQVASSFNHMTTQCYVDHSHNAMFLFVYKRLHIAIANTNVKFWTFIDMSIYWTMSDKWYSICL